MSDALIHHGRRSRSERTDPKPLPRGYGLLIALALSAALWFAIFWLLARAF